MKWILLAFAGATGTLLRYSLGRWSQGWTSSPFPIGIILTNVLGCLLMGFLGRCLTSPELLPESLRMSEAQRVAVLVGFLGGFTTFSTYAWDSVILFHTGSRGLAVANVILSNVLGILALWGGFASADRVLGSS